jgi:hypothetical protein
VSTHWCAHARVHECSTSCLWCAGPYGVKQIDQRLLTMINGRVKAVHDALAANTGCVTGMLRVTCDGRHVYAHRPLQALAKNFYHAPAVADAVKRLGALDATVADLVQLGCLQQVSDRLAPTGVPLTCVRQLRRLLREALGQALAQSGALVSCRRRVALTCTCTVPHMQRAAALAHAAYEPNRYAHGCVRSYDDVCLECSTRDGAFVPTDLLAADAGVDTFAAGA